VKKTLFYGAAAAATMHAHKRYAAVFFVLAVVGIAAAFFTRPKKSVRV